MKIKTKTFSFLLIWTLLFLSNFMLIEIAFADPPPSGTDAIKNMTFKTCETLPNSAGCPTDTTKPPADLTSFAGKAIGIMLQLVASIGIAVAVYGGFRMITSQGNDTGIKKGTSALTQAIIGIVIVLLAYVMISFIQGLIVH